MATARKAGHRPLGTFDRKQLEFSSEYRLELPLARLDGCKEV